MRIKRIIPCLDIMDGRVVKGVNFVNLNDAGDPVELALFYAAQGADELVFLNIASSREGQAAMIEVIKAVAGKISIPFTVGGGIENIDDIGTILSAGASKVSINTAAVKNPGLIRAGALKFGGRHIIAAIDARQKSGESGDSWEVYINGGRINTGLDVTEWARKTEELGAGEILLTSMDQDGTRDGYDNKLLAAVKAAVQIPVIASGGAGSLEHLYEAIVLGQADAVLSASIFHYREYTIAEAKRFLSDKGLLVS